MDLDDLFVIDTTPTVNWEQELIEVESDGATSPFDRPLSPKFPPIVDDSDKSDAAMKGEISYVGVYSSPPIGTDKRYRRHQKNKRPLQRPSTRPSNSDEEAAINDYIENMALSETKSESFRHSMVDSDINSAGDRSSTKRLNSKAGQQETALDGDDFDSVEILYWKRPHQADVRTSEFRATPATHSSLNHDDDVIIISDDEAPRSCKTPHIMKAVLDPILTSKLVKYNKRIRQFVNTYQRNGVVKELVFELSLPEPIQILKDIGTEYGLSAIMAPTNDKRHVGAMFCGISLIQFRVNQC